MPRSLSRAWIVSRSLSKAASSPNSPDTKRMPWDSCFQTSSLQGVLAYFFTASRTTWPKSWSSQSLRANPTSEKPGGSSPRLAKSYTAGMSFFRLRSPVTPKMIKPDGPAMRLSLRSAGSLSGFWPGLIFTGLNSVPYPRTFRIRAKSASGLLNVKLKTGLPKSAST